MVLTRAVYVLHTRGAKTWSICSESLRRELVALIEDFEPKVQTSTSNMVQFTISRAYSTLAKFK